MPPSRQSSGVHVWYRCDTAGDGCQADPCPHWVFSVASASSIDLPHARFWHRVSANSGPDDCGAFALVRSISATQSAIVLTDSPAGTGRASLVSGLACLVAARLRAGASPAGALAIADRSVGTVVRKGDAPLVVAAFVAVLDHTSGSLLYAAAGHDVAFIARLDGSWRPLPGTGPILGGAGIARFNVRRMFMRPGDTLVAATAGDRTVADEIVGSARRALACGADAAAAVIAATTRFGPGGSGADFAAIVTTLERRAA